MPYSKPEFPIEKLTYSCMLGKIERISEKEFCLLFSFHSGVEYSKGHTVKEGKFPPNFFFNVKPISGYNKLMNDSVEAHKKIEIRPSINMFLHVQYLEKTMFLMLWFLMNC